LLLLMLSTTTATLFHTNAHRTDLLTAGKTRMQCASRLK
jgi:hypothetical protein